MLNCTVARRIFELSCPLVALGGALPRSQALDSAAAAGLGRAHPAVASLLTSQWKPTATPPLHSTHFASTFDLDSYGLDFQSQLGELQ